MLSQTLWTEKYRPKSLDQMALPEDSRTFFQGIVSGERPLPNMLFHGPAGSGKTSLALLLASALGRREHILELNASSDREISVIRGRIKNFARTQAPAQSVKIIIMDECEYLTQDAQHCLRRIIEDTHGNTRFLFLTNYVSKIIDPIKSRLLSIYVVPTEKKENVRILMNIREKEDLTATEEDISDLLSASNNDLRKAVAALQVLSHFPDRERWGEVLCEVFQTVPESSLSEIITVRTPKEAQEAADSLHQAGFSVISVISGISAVIASSPSPAAFRMLLSLSQLECGLVLGGSEKLHLLSTALGICVLNRTRC